MKYSRQEKILELIGAYTIETQEELAEKLKEIGVDVTQATVSRDIKELRLIKVMDKDGRYKYASMNQGENTVPARIFNVFSQSVISSDYANNLVVLKTLPGMAQAAASAVDAINWPDIIGTIAGDDTIMIVCRTEPVAKELVEKFNKMRG